MNHHHGARADGLAEMLELDAEVLAPLLREMTELIAELRAGVPTLRIVDLGCGTGTATIAFARLFPAAEVFAIDGSDEMLALLRTKASALGLAERIVPIMQEVDTVWPVVDSVDLVWSALAMHHFDDPDTVLDRTFRATSPGSLLAVVEMDGQLRFLPEDLGIGRPGLEKRCHAALAHDFHTALPHLGADWGMRMGRAGFTVVAQRRIGIDLADKDGGTVGRYAMATLQGMRSRLDGKVDADDLNTLDILLTGHGPHALMHRKDLRLRGSRTVWIGRH